MSAVARCGPRADHRFPVPGGTAGKKRLTFGGSFAFQASVLICFFAISGYAFNRTEFAMHRTAFRSVASAMRYSVAKLGWSRFFSS